MSSEQLGTAEQVLYDLLTWVGLADSLAGVLFVICALFLIKGTLQFAQSSYIGYLQADLLKYLKTQFFDMYNGMTYRYFIDQNAGHFINVINAQVNRFFRSFRRFARALTKVVSAISFFTFAFLISWRFATMVLSIGVGLLVLFQYLNTYVQTLSRQVSGEMSRLNELLVQSLQAFKYIVSTSQTERLRFEVRKSIDQLTGDIFRQRMAGALTKSLREPISVFIVALVILIQAAVFEAPLAPIFVALILLHKGMQSMMAVQKRWQAMMDRIGSVEVVDNEMKSVQRHQESNGTREIGPLSNAIELQGVCFSYNIKGKDTLRDVDVVVPANKTVAFVGESGAGKSTLVDMLTLLLKPRTGEVRIDGVSSSEIELESWRSQVGYVSQDTVVFDDTVANNICLWQGDITKDAALRQRLIDAAKRAHAHRFITRLTEGYQTVVGDRGVRLSGGQRQRVFIARELFKKPNLLILDEATSDLDTASEKYIQESIDALQGEVTVVMIAHRLSTVKGADLIYVIEEGCVVESGTYSDLIEKDGGQFRNMVEMQSIHR